MTRLATTVDVATTVRSPDGACLEDLLHDARSTGCGEASRLFVPSRPFHPFRLFPLSRWIQARSPRPPGIGRGERSIDEPLRFSQPASLAFPSHDVLGLAFEATPAGRRVVVQQSRFGLWGAHGPMPLHLAETVHERSRRSPPDHAWASFADLFNHHWCRLLVRAWMDAQPTVGADRRAVAPEEDSPGGRWLALGGSTTPAAIRPRQPAAWVPSPASEGPSAPDRGDRFDEVIDDAIAMLRAHAPDGPRLGVGSLCDALSWLLQVPVRLRGPVVHLRLAAPEEHLRLGPARGASCLGLGHGAILGTRRHEATSRLRLDAGPPDAAGPRHLPDGTSRVVLSRMVRRLAPMSHAVELRWCRQAASLPRGTLSGLASSDDDGTIRLGRQAWIGRPVDGIVDAERLHVA